VRPVGFWNVGIVYSSRARCSAAAVARHRHHPGAGERERLQRRQVRRLLGEHDVARLQQHRRGERERLLGAAGHQHLVGVRRQPARGQAGRDRGPQVRVALGRRVLQRSPGVLERGRVGGAQARAVEQLGRGQAAGEGDHARARGQREDVADRRAADAA
jgi:hypothetical protein